MAVAGTSTLVLTVACVTVGIATVQWPDTRKRAQNASAKRKSLVFDLPVKLGP